MNTTRRTTVASDYRADDVRFLAELLADLAEHADAHTLEVLDASLNDIARTLAVAA
jgi:hypothetical protein